MGNGMNYGCHNAERKPGYFVKVRKYHPNGMFQIVDEHIEDTMSVDCRYDYKTTDELCSGCKK